MTKKRGALDDLIQSKDERLILAEESAMAHVALVVSELLNSRNVSQRQLAEMLGLTEARVSQILDAESNLTIKTMARIGCVLGHRFEVEFAPEFSSEQVVAAEQYSASSGSGVWEIPQPPNQTGADGEGLAA